jgi:hypothetical protein
VSESFPGALLLFIALMGAMVWIAWMGWRRSRFDGPSEVSAVDQALLAQRARAFFVDPQHRLCNPATPSEFDTHLLSLFDSIETNRDDIDAKLENLRIHLKSCGMWQRLKYKQKLDLVYRDSAAYLVRGRTTTAMRQLLANWRTVGRLGSSGSELSGAPKSWIRPLFDDSAYKPSSGVGGTSRKVLKLSGRSQTFVGAIFFSLTGSMIAYALSHDLTITLEWAIGIFVAYVVAYRVGIIKASKL